MRTWRKPLLLLALVAVLAVPTMPATASQTIGAPEQLSWLLAASTRPPVSETELRQHISGPYLDRIGGSEEFNRQLVALGTLRLERQLRTTPTVAEAVVSSAVGDRHASLAVDDSGLIIALGVLPYQPSPTSWSELDSRLKALAPRVSFTASVLEPNGECRQEHAVGTTEAQPLGSAFKLYVLGAVSDAVAAGRLDWDQELPIREKWKSLPSGRLQDEPAGTRLPLREYANLMISISDNTATDHLIHTVGRDAVLATMAKWGTDPAPNTPLLTTRELFALKGFQYPTLARTYLSLPPAGRTAMLPALDAVPRKLITGWTEPRNLDDIEYFATGTDMCAALSGLLNTADPAVDTAMSISDGGIALDRTEFPTVWYKGGSEPGLVALNHAAWTKTGEIVVTNLTMVDPTTPLDPATTYEALALARGGLELAT
jgi:beta-lactamase family protein